MLRSFFSRLFTAISKLFSPKSPTPQIEIDIMKPFEEAYAKKRAQQWYDVELSDVVHGQINYKI